jgi:hypothetical protein
MRWVDNGKYVGLDRRRRRAVRLLERREAGDAAQPPAVRTALRQLRMSVLEVNDQDGLDRFRAPAQAVADLARVQGYEDVANSLTALAAVNGARKSGQAADENQARRRPKSLPRRVMIDMAKAPAGAFAMSMARCRSGLEHLAGVGIDGVAAAAAFAG